MTSLRNHSSRLTILAILVALLPPLASEGHEPSGHPALKSFDGGSVFHSAHAEADRTLHIETVTAVGATHCHGCLLPKKEESDAAHRLAAKPAVGSGARLAGSPGRSAPRSPRSSPTPRAPPSF